MPITNYPTSGLQSLITNHIVQSTLAILEADPIISFVRNAEAPLQNTERAFAQGIGSTIDINLAPYFGGKKVTDMLGSTTATSNTFEKATVTLEAGYYERWASDPVSHEVQRATTIDINATRMSEAMKGAVRLYQTDLAEFIRTNANFAALGTSGNAINYTTLLRIRENFANKKVGYNKRIDVFCDYKTYHQILTLNEVNATDLRTSAIDVANNVFTIKQLNMRIISTGYYTAKVGASDPHMTAMIEGTIVAPTRAPMIIQDHAKYQTAITDSAINMTLSHQAPTFSGISVQSEQMLGFYAGFQMIPRVHSASGATGTARYLGLHIVGAIA